MPLDDPPPSVIEINGQRGRKFTIAEGGVRYEHVQSVPADTWTINHNLGAYPHVTIIDSAYDEIWADVDYTASDLNTLVLRFGAAFSGRAWLRL